MHKTRLICIDLLQNRIALAKKVMDLFEEQIKKNPHMAFMTLGTDGIQAAAYIKVFGEAINTISEGQIGRNELAYDLRQSMQTRMANRGYSNLSTIALLQFHSEITAVCETIEILEDSMW
jgi:hypothetical protein